MVERGCAVRTHRIDMCTELRTRKAIEVCETCNTDACNKADLLRKHWFALILMPVLATFLKSFS